MNNKPKICMNAMVGNEAKTITRMLESVAPHISYWVIQCNGKEDNTKEIIEKFFNDRGIPGFTYEIDWNYPGWNRNHTLQRALQANHACDWILRMDADERLHIDEDFDWNILADTTIDSFNVPASAADIKYFRTWLWNAKLPWFFADDKRHETIHLPQIGENFVRVNLPFSFRHLVSQDGETWHVPRKFLRDALELEIDKVVGNKVKEDPYHLWYIAKSYSDCYGNPDELPFGRLHSEEYARRSIWYYNRFLEQVHDWHNQKVATRFDEMAYFAFIMMGQAMQFLGQTDDAIQHYYWAGQFAPMRNEHYVYLNFLLQSLNRNEELLRNLEYMLSEDRVNPWPNSSFLIESRAYYDTSDFLINWKKEITQKLSTPTVSNDSFRFDPSQF